MTGSLLTPDAAPGKPVTFEAVVERVVYTNEESAWGVAKLRRDGGALVPAVGRLFGIRPGERLRLTGAWETDRKWGVQFRVDTYLPVQPSTVEGIERYLGSGLVPGIGKVMARRLVAAFGLETLDVIDNDPGRLSSVEGIGPVRSAKIRAAWREQRAVREVMLFLQSLGIAPSHAARIFKRWGQAAIAEIKANPYRLADEISGIGFETADRIAARLGIARDSPRRIEAGVLYVLGRAADRGHLYLPWRRALETTAETLETEPAAVERAVAALRESRGVIAEKLDGADAPVLYLPPLHRAEVESAAHLGRLLERPATAPPIDAERALAWFERRRSLSLAEAQRRAVRLALQEKVMVVTGGPGTGKTTLVRAVVAICARKGLKMLLAAPTGRAAKRLSESAGMEARTIHRLLEFDPGRGGFRRDAERRLNADLVVIDEASMLDSLLAFHLLSALPDGARLVLVGDVDQLPSVGPGKVLEEIIASGRVPVVRLDRVFRQARASRIVINAHRVRRGELPALDGGRETDFFFIERGEPAETLATVLHLVGERVPRGFGLDPHTDVQVLTPMRRGLLGADNLNRELQALLNPGRGREGRGLAAGDRVMQTRNNYELEVFNGDIGRVERVDDKPRRLQVAFDERKVLYEGAQIDELALAYASSVHKAQGSEYPCVVMPLHTQHYVMLQRNLLYTAITRAQRLMVLVGERRALAVAVRNDRQQRRYTALARRLG